MQAASGCAHVVRNDKSEEDGAGVVVTIKSGILGKRPRGKFTRLQ